MGKVPWNFELKLKNPTFRNFEKPVWMLLWERTPRMHVEVNDETTFIYEESKEKMDELGLVSDEQIRCLVSLLC